MTTGMCVAKGPSVVFDTRITNGFARIKAIAVA
jgi:hypothetical protein